jgi:hypothetical protein
MENSKNDLRMNLMYRQEGKCFFCQTEEWRCGKRFHLHRIIKGKNGGEYSLGNVLLFCFKCHRKAEGLNYGQLLVVREQFSSGYAETVMAS